MPRHLPYSLKPEFVRGCTMRCVFCGLRNQPWAEEKYEYISAELWGQYVEAVAVWRPRVRVEIANRGEPTVHPHFLELIRMGRAALPKAQFLVSTNGDLSDQIGLKEFRELIREAQTRGVNCFLLDCYTPKRLREFRELFAGDANLFFDDGANPYPYRGPDWRALIIKDACTYKSEDGRAPKENVILNYHNQGGNAIVDGTAARMYPNVTALAAPLERMCVRPFREMPIWFDGSVPLCCDDWGDKHIVGRFPDQTLPELWDALDPARRELVKKNRAGLSPCNKCSEGQGKRFGLELNWFGDRAPA